MVDLVLDSASLESGCFGRITPAVLVGRLHGDRERTCDVPKDVEDRETPFLGRLALLGALHDHRVDEDERRRGVRPDVDHGDTARYADLIRRQADAFGGAHRLEQVVDQPADLLVHGRDRNRPLTQHRRAKEVEVPDRHADLASAPLFRIVAMLLRITTSLASPLRIVTSFSLRCTTSPMIPPEVTIWSPRCSAASSCLCFCCCWRWGRINRK